MSATTYTSAPARAIAISRSLKAEWTKLRTLPSTWRTAAVTVHRPAGLLRPGAALVVLAVYAAIALGAAAPRVAHRDA